MLLESSCVRPRQARCCLSLRKESVDSRDQESVAIRAAKFGPETDFALSGAVVSRLIRLQFLWRKCASACVNNPAAIPLCLAQCEVSPLRECGLRPG
jgi:hypothetical protein